MELKCPRCEHVWNYRGKAQYHCACPNCLKRIKFKQPNPAYHKYATAVAADMGVHVAASCELSPCKNGDTVCGFFEGLVDRGVTVICSNPTPPKPIKAVSARGMEAV